MSFPVVDRSWGYYRIEKQTKKKLVKFLCIKPHCKTSFQRHLHRNEEVVVYENNGNIVKLTLRIDDKYYEVTSGNIGIVPQNTWHQYINDTDHNLYLEETWTGDLFDENDIERKPE